MLRLLRAPHPPGNADRFYSIRSICQNRSSRRARPAWRAFASRRRSLAGSASLSRPDGHLSLYHDRFALSMPREHSRDDSSMGLFPVCEKEPRGPPPGIQNRRISTSVGARTCRSQTLMSPGSTVSVPFPAATFNIAQPGGCVKCLDGSPNAS